MLVDRATNTPPLIRAPSQRVLIIGSGGSGKSTLARELAQRLRLPLIHLDQLYWKPGWVEPERATWTAHVDQLIASEAWIMDGNYGGTLERRLQRAQLVIWLDLSRWLCLWRVLRRQIQYWGRTRPELPEGCPEHFSLAFLAWIWFYPARRRPQILQQLVALPPAVTVQRLRTPGEVRRFLEHVTTAS